MAAEYDLSALSPAERAHVVRRCFREALSTPEGLVVRAELRRVGRYGKPTFVIDDPGGRRSAALEGKRWMTTFIEAMCAPDDEALTELLVDDNITKEKRRGRPGSPAATR